MECLFQLFIVIGVSMTYIVGTFIPWRMLVLAGYTFFFLMGYIYFGQKYNSIPKYTKSIMEFYSD